MEKQIFKTGDKVFDIRFGWGVVDEVDRIDSLLSVKVKFDNYKNQFISYNHKGCRNKLEENPMLSFTEYTLDGFSQERSINYEDYIGKWGKFWDDYNDEFLIDRLERKVFSLFHTYGNHQFSNFQPLTEEQIKILGLEQ